MTIPKIFADQNGLVEGSQVKLHISGRKMTVETFIRPRYRLVDLMAEMSASLPKNERIGHTDEDVTAPGTGDA